MIEEEEVRVNPASGMHVQGIACFCTGILVVGYGGARVFSEKDGLDALAAVYDEAGSTSNSFAITALYMAIAIGGLVMGLGIGGIGSYFLKSRIFASVVLVLIVAASVLQIVGAVLYGGLVARSERVLVPNPNEADYDIHERSLLEVGNAVYNECCNKVWNVTDNPLINDDDRIGGDLRESFQSPIQECPTFSPLPQVVVDLGLVEELASCWEPPFIKILTYLQAPGECEKFEVISATAGENLEVPSVSLKLVTALRGQGFLSDTDTIERLRMVGIPARLDENGDPGFGCGLMYAKGVAWVQSLFLAEVGQTTTYIIYAAASIQMISAVMAVAFWFLSSEDGGPEEWMAYDKNGGYTTGARPEI